MTASNSQKSDWLAGRGAATLSEGERARRQKLRIVVVGIVGACGALTVLAAVMSLLGH